MLNKIQIIGRLGKDPETVTFQNGGRISKFSVATSEKWKDKTTGEVKENTEWHNIQVGERSVDFCEKYLKKGDLVYIEGKSSTTKKDDKYFHQINALTVQKLTWDNDGENKPQQQQSAAPSVAPAPAPAAAQNEEDDDLPF